MIFRIEHHRAGPRVFIANRRIHHGTVGLLLCLLDIRDARCWLRDLFHRLP